MTPTVKVCAIVLVILFIAFGTSCNRQIWLVGGYEKVDWKIALSGFTVSYLSREIEGSDAAFQKFVNNLSWEWSWLKSGGRFQFYGYPGNWYQMFKARALPKWRRGSYKAWHNRCRHSDGDTCILNGAIISESYVILPLWIPALVLIVALFVSARRNLHRTRPGCCRKCGYRLIGNTSGKCSECGLTISDAIKHELGAIAVSSDDD